MAILFHSLYSLQRRFTFVVIENIKLHTTSIKQIQNVIIIIPDRILPHKIQK